ncbi:MAG: DUF4338 domain-containing protein [SAR324 cluster bacterium]|nr:DUF4338 domain-containing protein [SAR324 cluster bacterium]
MVCRSFMLELHRAGHIVLPPKKRETINNLAKHNPPVQIQVGQSPVVGRLGEIGSIEFCQVRRQPGESLCNSLIEQYHYLGYVQPVGEHLKYLISAGGRPVACMTFSSAPRHIGCRDRYIGWSPEVRLKNLRLIAYNSRFLILPWVQVRFLASHLLSGAARIIADDWQALYHHPVHYLETFVDTERYAGTCYHAANWRFVGKTTGRGKNDQTNKPNRSIKDVLGYPLLRDFRQKLGVGQ